MFIRKQFLGVEFTKGPFNQGAGSRPEYHESAHLILIGRRRDKRCSIHEMICAKVESLRTMGSLTTVR